MFGRPKPIVLQPYGRRRARRVPRWLVLLATGVALGAAAVVVVQERYLPPRLSAAQSAELQRAYAAADAERHRLATELGATGERLAAALADRDRLGDELASGRETIRRLRGDVASLVAALPPDPRGGEVEVRAARLSVDGDALSYDVVLTRERKAARPQAGVLQIVLAGEPARGADASVTLKPVAISLGDVESLRGSVPLPDGFKPRQATVSVLDRPDGRRLGMRVVYVK